MSGTDLAPALARLVEAVEGGAPINEAHADTCSMFVLSASDARRLLALFTDRDVVTRIELSGDAVGEPVTITIRGGDDEGYTVSTTGDALPGGGKSRGFFGPLAFVHALDYAAETVKWVHADTLAG